MTDQIDLQGFLMGDRLVLGALYRDYYEAMRLTARNQLDPYDSDRCIHDIFVSLLTRPELRASFQGGNMRAWLCKLVFHRAQNILRESNNKENHRPLEAPPGRGDDQEEALIAEEVIDKFKLTLPPKYHPFFDLYFLKGMSITEVADALGKRRTTVQYWKCRCRGMLLTFLSKNGYNVPREMCSQPIAMAGED